MVFNLKGAFFLDLDKSAPKEPVAVAPVTPKAEPAKAKTVAAPAQSLARGPQNTTQPAAAAVAAASSAIGAPGGKAKVLTTAEVIAAELRLAQENRPAPSTATFAPDLLIPSGALPRSRRRAGANLAGFKAIAKSLTGG